MNVLLVSQPARDGVLRHVIGLAQYLISKGDRVHLTYSDFNASDQLAGLLDQVRSAGGKLLNLGVRNSPQLEDLPAILRLSWFIQTVRPDAIHAHSSKAGALVRGLGLLGLRTPILYTPHSYYRMNDAESLKVNVFLQIERLLGRVGTTITISRAESNFAIRALEIPLSKHVNGRNAVDYDVHCPAAKEERLALRARLGLPRNVKLLGSVGRFSPQKDPVTMYSAFAEVVDEMPDVHLAHLGEGELKPEVQELIAARGISGRCHHMAYLKQTAPFYRALDGFFLTSLYEGLPYAVLEALATNLPLVLTRAPGNDEFEGQGFSHLEWCEPGNVASIAAALRAWRMRLEGGQLPNHRAISSRIYTWEASFGPVREAYQRLSGLQKAAMAEPEPQCP